MANIIKSRDSISDISGICCPRTGDHGDWPQRFDTHTVVEPAEWVQSACVLCSNGCGMDIGVKEGRIVGVRGRAVVRVNHGRLGPKGQHGWQANHSADRLTTPLIRRDGRLQPARWVVVLLLVVRRTREAKQNYSAREIGFNLFG